MNDPLPDDLRRALDVLDARAEVRAARVDAGRLAGRVLHRLRAEPAAPARPWYGAPRVLALAAALAVLAATAGVVAVRTPGGAPAVAAGLPVDLGTDSLDLGADSVVLAAVEQARTLNDSSVAASIVAVDDLSEQELTALLETIETLSTDGGEL